MVSTPNPDAIPGPLGGRSKSEQRCLTSAESLEKLYQEVLQDLDTENGGVRWWHGQVDWRRNCLMADYLMAAAQGAGSSLRYAALAIEHHREQSFADRTWVSVRVSEGAKRGLAPALVIQRGPRERDRLEKIAMARQHTVFHLAQALDQLAAAAALVLGLPEGNIMYFDWTRLRAVAEQAAKQSVPTGATQELRMKLLVPGTPGRKLQDAALKIVRDSYDSQPEQWLDWLLTYRNAVTHRPSPISWYLTHTTAGRTDAVISPLHRQPDWPQLRAMVQSSRTRLQDMFLQKDPDAQLSGLFESVQTLVTDLADTLCDVWAQRRSHPDWIVQRGGAWQELSNEKELSFYGYGPVDRGLEANGEYVVMHPDLARRLAGVRMDTAGLRLWSQPD